MRLWACLLVLMLLPGACAQAAPGDRHTPASAEASGHTSQSEGVWDPISDAPEGWYRPEGAFWIDGRLVVVAASTIEAWDPQIDVWEVLVRIPQADDCEGCGYSEIAVWTGAEVLLWGGGFSYRAEGSQSAGAAFDPRSRRLRALPPAPISPRWWHTAVWTGQEMIVWGGACGQHECRDGAAYDPASDSWRPIADAPMGGYAHRVVWTGREMIAWGGSDDYQAEGSFGFPRTFLNSGYAYSAASDSWRELAQAPLEPRGWHSAVWTGREMIVWGGVMSPCTTSPCEAYPVDTAAYDPLTDRWRQIAQGPLSGRVDHSAVWTGEHMIVWGGSPPGGGLGYDDGALYDPAADAWWELAQSPMESRYRHAALWTGGEMIIWGGEGGGSGSFADGAVFRP